MEQERLNRLDTMMREGRIIRGAWDDGKGRACLLAALSPEAGRAKLASACPAEVMPAWLAHLTPWLDDAPSAETWPGIVVQRYAGLAHRWSVLDDAGWERARIGALIIILREARSHVAPEHLGVLDAVDGVLAWLGRGAPECERNTFEAAAWAERAAAWVAGEAAAWAVRSAAWAARSAAARAAQAAAWAAGEAASEASADRIAAGVLDAIEREIEAAEGGRS